MKKNMNVQDYLKYSAKITPDGKFYMIEIDGKGWEGALSQGRDLEEAHMMAKAVIYDYIEGLVEFKKRIPEPQVVDDGINLLQGDEQTDEFWQKLCRGVC